MLRRNRALIISLMVALVIIFGVRTFIVSIVKIPNDGEQPYLLAGDRVLVNRWSYGFRMPCSRVFGRHRWCVSLPNRGDWVAFNNPAVERGALADTSGICVGHCMALPGDTVWMSAKGQFSQKPTSKTDVLIRVPAYGQSISITKNNVRLYAYTINLFEPQTAAIVHDTLFVGGTPTTSYKFNHNYYWMTSGNQSNSNDSRMMGLVPHEFLLGRLTRVLYSFNPKIPWLGCWRTKRTFNSIPKQ